MIKFLHEWVLGPIWIFRLALRKGMGRWYVLRDAPDWLLHMLTELEWGKDQPDYKVLEWLVEGAKSELSLRNRRSA